MDSQNQNPIEPRPNNQPKPPPEHGLKAIQPSEAFVNEMALNKPIDVDAAPPNPIATSNASPAVYPEPTASSNNQESTVTQSLVGLTGSQMQPQKAKVPVGIYIIVGILFFDCILGLFTSNSNTFDLISLFVNLALGVGLLFRKEIARKILVILSSILIILLIITIVGLVLLLQKEHRVANKAQEALNNLSSGTTLTETQSLQINAYQQQIKSDQKVLNKQYNYIYIKDGIIIAANFTIIYYLTRPKIKSFFNELEDKPILR